MRAFLIEVESSQELLYSRGQRPGSSYITISNERLTKGPCICGPPLRQPLSRLAYHLCFAQPEAAVLLRPPAEPSAAGILFRPYLR